MNYSKYLFLLAFCLAGAAAWGEGPPEAGQTGGVRALLVSQLETTLSSQINASIKSLAVKGGDRFKRGQTLVEFDCRLYQAQLNKARAQLQAAEKTYDANLNLQKFQAISALEVSVAQAKVAEAKAEIALYSTQVGLCRIEAPFNGRVIGLHTAQYASVSSGDKLLDVLDDGQLEVQVRVPSAWIGKIQKGGTFQVRIDETGKTYQAEVSRLGAKVDAVSQTLEITGKILDKDTNLLAGMSGTANFDFP